MISILIVSHGKLAEGMLDAMSMITGPQENVASLGLQESDSPEELMDRIKESINQMDHSEGVLIMVDLYGATPFNSSWRFYMENDIEIEIITGFNLPMLVEIVINREGTTLSNLLDKAIHFGMEGIKKLPSGIRKK